MPRPRLSPWFPEGTNPARTGVYKTKFKNFDDPGHAVRYARWDGAFWHVGRLTTASAASVTHVSQFQRRQWRGILKD